MKKVFFAAVAVLALASCKKDYTCKIEVAGISTSQDYEGLDKDEAKSAESACELAGGKWSTK